MATTERTVIRAVIPDDLETTRAWRNDRRVWSSTLGRRFPISEVGERQWFEALNQGTFPTRVVWAVADESGTLVGVVQLDDIDWIHRTAWFGVFIGPEHWGFGHATRATRQVCEFALVELGLRQIRLRVLSDHEAARAVYARNGFTPEAALGGAVLVDGAPRDVEIMVLTERSWQAAGTPVPHENGEGR